MADTRINALTGTATTVATDDYMALDGTTNGTRKILGSAFITSVTGTTNQITVTTTTGASTVALVSSPVVSGTYTDGAGDLRSVPQNAKTSAYTLVVGDNGKYIDITTGGVTVPSGVFSAGQVVVIYNNSTSNQTITQGSSVTMYQSGTTNTGNRTLAAYGVATVLCTASNTFVITGSGLS